MSRGRPTFILLTLSLLLPAYGRPQDAAGEPEEGGLASRIARWLEQPRRIQQQLAGVGVVPILSGFAQGTGPAPGLSVFRPRLIGPLDVTLAGGFSLHGDSFQDVRVGRLPHEAGRPPSRRQSLESMAPAFAAGAPERRFAYAELRHRNFDGGLVFDDVGGAIPYRLEDTSIDLVAGQRLGERWLLGLRTGVVSGAARVVTSGTEISGDGRMGAWLSASAKERDGYFRTAASLAYDDRDHPRRPTQGSYLELSLSHFGGMQQHPSFDRLTLDARRFQALGSPERVLALRASATLDGGTGAEVPFYLLDTLGGDRLRGYDPYRFRGPSVIAFSAEYRQAVARSLEAVAFWDVGRAWGGAPAMGTDGLRGSYGLGVRLLSPSGVLLRLEGARGAEGVRFQARLGFAF